MHPGCTRIFGFAFFEHFMFLAELGLSVDMQLITREAYCSCINMGAKSLNKESSGKCF